MPEDKKQQNLAWSAPEKPAPLQEADPQGSTPQTLSPQSSRRNMPTQAPIYASFLVGGIIVGVLLATAQSAYDQREDSAIATSTAQSAITTTTAASGTAAAANSASTEASVLVSDQPAGGSVAIGQLAIARPTWVVVYVSREGKPGNALGARLFFAGDKQGRVSLLRNTIKGQAYVVGLSADDGDRIFSLSKDKPVADADGRPLWATFRAQ